MGLTLSVVRGPTPYSPRDRGSGYPTAMLGQAGQGARRTGDTYQPAFHNGPHVRAELRECAVRRAPAATRRAGGHGTSMVPLGITSQVRFFEGQFLRS